MRLTLLLLAFLSGPASAAPVDDLNLAAASDVPAVARQEAFDRLVVNGLTDTALVHQVAADQSADTRKRWVAIRVLGHVGGDRAEQALISLLDDPQPAIRAAVAGALGETGTMRHTPSVIALLEDPAIIVRAEAATALAQLRDPSAVPALAKALEAKSGYRRDTSLWVRRHYVLALGSIGHKDGIPALVRALDDEDLQVAEAAIPALEQIGGFSMGEGRSWEQQREAWRRWGQAQGR